MKGMEMIRIESTTRWILSIAWVGVTIIAFFTTLSERIRQPSTDTTLDRSKFSDTITAIECTVVACFIIGIVGWMMCLYMELPDGNYWPMTWASQTNCPMCGTLYRPRTTGTCPNCREPPPDTNPKIIENRGRKASIATTLTLITILCIWHMIQNTVVDGHHFQIIGWFPTVLTFCLLTIWMIWAVLTSWLKVLT